MTQTENEQELVLGNKQLLSAFFVVVALLGVFFTMGYIIGRNTGGSASSAKETGTSAASLPETSGRPSPVRSLEPETEPVPAPARQQEPPPVAEKTKPARSVPAREAVEQSAPVVAKPVAVQSGTGHLYLQLMAVKLADAENMVKVLKKRGFPALTSESSKPELYRVLVGPFPDMPALAKTKGELKSAGFESVVVR